MKTFFRMVVLVAGVVMCQPGHASHIMGGELTYKATGGGNYLIILVLYRDCTGIPVNQTDLITVSSVFHSISQSVTVTQVDTGISGIEICDSASVNSHCSGNPNATYADYRKYTFTGTVTLTPATDWIFSYNNCCRNSAITNLVNVGIGTTLIATLNNSLSDNSSPVFATRPVIFIKGGRTQTLSWNASDPNGDSLSYQLVAPLETNGAPLAYIAGFTAAQPFTSFAPTLFDTVNGIMTVSPSAIQVSVVSMLINEYRNGRLIGSVRRDLQINVLFDHDSVPQLTGINGSGNYNATACVGQQLRFTLFGSDPDATQKLNISADTLIANSLFTVNNNHTGNPVATFAWTPSLTDAGNDKLLDVSVQDSYCPYSTIKIYNIHIHIDSTCNNSVVAVADSFSVASNDSVLMPVLANDSGNIDPATVVVLATPAHGTASVDSFGRIMYIPNTGFLGQDTLSYVVCSTGLLCDTALVIISAVPGLDYYVWPGDANNDGTVDQNDILAIGLAYGHTGAVRPNATLNWTAQYCLDWPDTLPGNINMKYADGDGNGMVDYSDTIPVAQNFSLTHPRGGGMADYRNNLPNLYLQFSSNTATQGQALSADLMLGSSSFPVSNAYGLAFNLNLSGSAVDFSSVNLSFDTSWLNPVSTYIPFAKNNTQSLVINAAITGTNHLPHSGYGKIGTLHFNTLGNHFSGTQLVVSYFTDLVTVDNNGYNININPVTDTVIVIDPFSIKNTAENKLGIYPVPAGDKIFVDLESANVKRVTAQNMLGELINPAFEISNTRLTVAVAGLAKGIYVLKVKTEMGEYVGRFCKL